MIQIGITGHRDLKKVCVTHYRKELETLLKALKKEHTSVILYSALADGADRLIVEVAIALNIDYIVVLPMEKVVYCQDFSQSSLKKFEYFLNNALAVKEMPLLENRDAQYEIAGRYISDKSNILISLWDGCHTYLQGGTSEIVKYHLSKASYRFYFLLVSRESDLTKNMIEFKYYEKR
jgi:hypothetical protein